MISTTILLLILLLLLITYNEAFTNTYINFTTHDIRQPTTIVITFTTTTAITTSNYITITLPRFSRTNDGSANPDATYSLSVLRVSPSTQFSGIWQEGSYFNRDYFNDFSNYNNSVPYKDAYVRLSPLSDIGANVVINVNITIENGLMAYCGFAGTLANSNTPLPYIPVTENFQISLGSGASTSFDVFGWIGDGCTSDNSCSGHGVCDWCYNRCICQDGYGSSSDIIMIGKNIKKDCSEQVCQSGKAIVDVPSSPTQAHAKAECSNRGICNRDKGTCKCFYPFTGSACERMSCPNECSGNGACLSMAEIAELFSVQNPTYNVTYGSATGMNTIAWDYDTIYGCMCDSSWSVGYGSGMVQVSEFFGPDCSLKHCPSGDDPLTPDIDETNCFNITQPGNSQNLKGLTGNLCQVDCSNRGLCDYTSGRCQCFDGFYGDACSNFNSAKHYSAKSKFN